MASATAMETPKRKGVASTNPSSGSRQAAQSSSAIPAPSEPVPPLEFAGPTDTTIALTDVSVLTNESSSYHDVSKVCLSLCQLAGGTSTSVLHHATFASAWSRVWHALGTCLQHHTDRQCRMTAARTLAITAKAAYAQLRPSPLLYSQAYPSVRAVEDEVGSDVAMLLCTTALEATDDGVTAACLSALDLLLSTGSSSTYGGLDDELAVHTCHLTLSHRPSPYAPTLRSVTDLDVGIVVQELALRIMENVVAPRLVALVDRVGRLTGPYAASHTAAALPCLVTCLVQHAAASIHPVTLCQTDRLTYSKRWSEWDVTGLMTVVVSTWLIPALVLPHPASPSCTATAMALVALRLAQAPSMSTQSWVPSLCAGACHALRCAATTGRGDASLVALVGVASRALPRTERTSTLYWMATQIVTWPRTLATSVSGGASVRVLDQGDTAPTFRHPARMALWTELVLGFFWDGPSGNSSGATTSSRHACLQTFLTSPVVARLWSATDTDATVAQQRDELLLACTSVAIECGRRFRVTFDGTVADGTHESVVEWLALVQVVLTTTSGCVSSLVPPGPWDERLSMSTAGLARYVQLLQEYLHFVGLLHASGSVALKLAVHACPPHILWDRLTESATFLSRFDSTDLGCMDFTTELLDGFVNQEMKEGIPSHHARLLILALAADHWVQGRATVIRKQFESTATTDTTVTSLTLNMRSGRDTLLALAPKRLLDKVIQAHVPAAHAVDSDGKAKRDPLKKLATEIVRVSVACIENIALMACDWRRRFGSSPESKHIVSVAVGLLQGKTDETPMDDLMKAVMGPVCDAAVKRIQAFYESSGQGSLDQSFPLSALVTQSVRTKIKPLVSSTKPTPPSKDEFISEYLMQLCRQIVASRIQLAIDSSPSADSLLLPARPVNWLRLAVPPVAEHKDGRLYGGHAEALSAWGHTAITSSSASDAVQLVAAYTPRRFVRYDGDDEYRICIVVKAFNMTALTIYDGLRLELGISSDGPLDDDETKENIEALGGDMEDLLTDTPLLSIAAEYKDELKSGEYVTWEVDLPVAAIASSNSLRVTPSLVYRNVPKEPEDVGANVVGEKPAGEGSTVGAESQNGEDDFRVRQLDEAKSFRGANTETEDIRLVAESLILPPLIVCQPCPLVFYCNRCGDLDSFRFLWFRLPLHLAPMQVVGRTHPVKPNPITQKIATMSSLSWDGEAIPGGSATCLWAFLSLSGYRVCCVLTESDSNDTETQQTLHFRGDNKALLYSFIGSKTSRDSVVAALLPGMVAKS